jgi:hypothetical protein
MSNPYYHALSTAKQQGGDWQHYFAIHEWFDSTKAAYADVRHRAILHHDFGAALAQRIFGEAVAGVPTAMISVQHLKEDTRTSPNVEKWLGRLEPKDWMRRGQRITAETHAQRSAEKFGGLPSDYLELHRFLDEPRSYWDDPRSRAVLHHSFGIFLAAQVFGPVLNVTGKRHGMPTRYVAESHVFQEMRFIPSIENWLDELPRETWMNFNAAQLSQEYVDSEDNSNA